MCAQGNLFPWFLPRFSYGFLRYPVCCYIGYSPVLIYEFLHGIRTKHGVTLPHFWYYSCGLPVRSCCLFSCCISSVFFLHPCHYAQPDLRTCALQSSALFLCRPLPNAPLLCVATTLVFVRRRPITMLCRPVTVYRPIAMCRHPVIVRRHSYHHVPLDLHKVRLVPGPCLICSPPIIVCLPTCAR